MNEYCLVSTYAVNSCKADDGDWRSNKAIVLKAGSNYNFLFQFIESWEPKWLENAVTALFVYELNLQRSANSQVREEISYSNNAL